MKTSKSFLLAFLVFIFWAVSCWATPYFLIDSFNEWEEPLMSPIPGEPNISAITFPEWNDYMFQWNMHLEDGNEYPPNVFIEPTLYVYTGDSNGGGPHDPPEVNDAGLVMAWGDSSMSAGSYSSGWKYEYGLDPDLSRAIITVTVTPPSGSGINAISFGMQDIGGNIRSWWWSVGPGGVIPLDVPTTVTIDCTKINTTATYPVASGFANNPGFDITKVMNFLADENAQWVGGPTPAVPPGGPVQNALWNYWHNLMVTHKTQANKGCFVKWSQPPIVIDANNPPTIWGWDERSDYNEGPIVADDWLCTDKRPITDIHWWGSFIGWTQPKLPPAGQLPIAFHIGIWTDVPDPDPLDPAAYSHPGTLIWENICTSWVWNFAGYDEDPREEFPPMPFYENEACFQFNQLLPQDEWFYQDGNEPNGTVYWVSISAIYPPQTVIYFPFGWKTRPHFYNDDAVIIQDVAGLFPPHIGQVYNAGIPIQLPPWPALLPPNPELPSGSWDMSFELTTNEEPPCHTLDADLNHDCIVNLFDFAIFAGQWLDTSP